MKCSKCSAEVLTEDIGNGKVKCSCKACGKVETRDSAGRSLLTETTPARGPLMG